MTEPLRLSKCVIAQRNCSRREADLLIEGGWVMVDGEVVEEPQFKVLGQTITVHPEATLNPIEPVTLLLHKPSGYDFDAGDKPSRLLIDAQSRAPDDDSRIRLLKKHLVRLQPLMPLETAACGLLVFSQDYAVARKLTEDANKIEQEFIVDVSGNIATDGLKLLNHGLDFAGKILPPIKVSWQNETRLRFALKAPQPGQIAHMCNAVGLQALTIKRIRIGRRPMGNLPTGQWRYLPAYEKF